MDCYNAGHSPTNYKPHEAQLRGYWGSLPSEDFSKSMHIIQSIDNQPLKEFTFSLETPHENSNFAICFTEEK